MSSALCKVGRAGVFLTTGALYSFQAAEKIKSYAVTHGVRIRTLGTKGPNSRGTATAPLLLCW